MNAASQFTLMILLKILAVVVPLFSLIFLLKEVSFAVMMLSIFYMGAAILHTWLHNVAAARAAAGSLFLAAVIASHIAFFFACALQCDIMEGRPNMFILLLRLFGAASSQARAWRCSAGTDLMVFIPWVISLWFVSGGPTEKRCG